jgi:hypothetical protein
MYYLKKSVKTTGREFADRRASLLKKIHYDPKSLSPPEIPS